MSRIALIVGELGPVRMNQLLQLFSNKLEGIEDSLVYHLRCIIKKIDYAPCRCALLCLSIVWPLLVSMSLVLYLIVRKEF